MKYFTYTPGAYNYGRLPNVRLIICTVKNKTREETGKHQYLMSLFKALPFAENYTLTHNITHATKERYGFNIQLRKYT